MYLVWMHCKGGPLGDVYLSYEPPAEPLTVEAVLRSVADGKLSMAEGNFRSIITFVDGVLVDAIESSGLQKVGISL